MSSTQWSQLRKQAEDATRPLPNDFYDVEVAKTEATNAASSGAPMIKATLKVAGGPHDGRTLWHNFTLSENTFAMSLFFAHLAAFGLDDQFFKGLETANAGVESDMRTIANTLIGRIARAEVGTKQWQGQDRNEIKQFKAAQGSPLSVGGPAVPMPGAPMGGGMPPIPTSAMVPPSIPTQRTSSDTTPSSPPPTPF